MENKEKDHLIHAKNICKFFDGVMALEKVNLTVDKGKILCLVGENGSGKSTLIKCIAGVLPIDTGEIIINGNTYKKLHAIDSIREGIQVIYQDLSLFPELTVMENISLNQMVEQKKKLVNWSQIRKIAIKEMEKIGVNLNLDDYVLDLSIANRQIVAIIRALTQNVKLIIMDEPTTALTKSEIDRLFSIILDLKSQGISTMFVSHKLNEVLEISENVIIIRDGINVGVFKKEELDYEKLTFYMTGQNLKRQKYTFEKDSSNTSPVLELKKLSKKENYDNINLSVYPGEIIGIIGPLGSGRTELALSLFGLNKPDEGEIYINGKKSFIRYPEEAVKNGIGLLPEDRHNQGLFLDASIKENIIISTLKKIRTKLKFIDTNKSNKMAKEKINELKIKTPSEKMNVGHLSGGNQQRVVIAKWLLTDLKVFLLDGPTVGIDIASKSEIHSIIKNCAKKGMAIILISDEVPEILYNCNRIFIMNNGKIIEELDTSKVTEDELYNILSMANQDDIKQKIS
jgi:simple sugar transport system ATP-binding protein